MILTKYIFREIFKNQLIILILLLLVCICQKLIKIFGADNSVSIYLIFLYLTLNIPELGKLIIPFSLFLSVIITYYRLHIHNEILAMYSCGIKKSFFIQKILLYSFIISCLAFINMSWVSPYCEQYRNNILFRIKKNTCFNKLIEKKFQFFSNKTIILFADSIHDTTLKNIFIIKKRKDKNNNTFSVITSDQGNLYYNDGYLQSIVLKTGTYYEIPHNQTKYTNIYITNFSQHQILIDYHLYLLHKIHDTVNNMSITQLWFSSSIETKIELHWRLILLISIFILPLIAFLLMSNISDSYLLNFLLAIILYTFFFLSQILLRSYAILECSYFILWSWLVNFIYLIIAFLIDLWKKFRLTVF